MPLFRVFIALMLVSVSIAFIDSSSSAMVSEDGSGGFFGLVSADSKAGKGGKTVKAPYTEYTVRLHADKKKYRER